MMSLEGFIWEFLRLNNFAFETTNSFGEFSVSYLITSRWSLENSKAGEILISYSDFSIGNNTLAGEGILHFLSFRI